MRLSVVHNSVLRLLRKRFLSIGGLSNEFDVLSRKRKKVNMKSFDIRLQEGFGGLKFGASLEEAGKCFGTPDQTDVLEGPDGSEALVWHYLDYGFSLFFDRGARDVFSTVELDKQTNPQLWEKNLFELDEKALKALFRANGYTEIDEERHTWGEKRITFDEAHIDFYFENGRMVSINFGVMLTSEELKLFSN